MSIVILLSMSKFVYFTFCSVLKLSRYQENICEKKLRNFLQLWLLINLFVVIRTKRNRYLLLEKLRKCTCSHVEEYFLPFECTPNYVIKCLNLALHQPILLGSYVCDRFFQVIFLLVPLLSSKFVTLLSYLKYSCHCSMSNYVLKFYKR